MQMTLSGNHSLSNTFCYLKLHNYCQNSYVEYQLQSVSTSMVACNAREMLKLDLKDENTTLY